MFKRCNILKSYCILASLLLYFNHPVSALSCFKCASTFSASSICLPSCTPLFLPNNTCILTRNIPLEPTEIGSLRAGHISEEPMLSDVEEKYFIFGEEAAYLNPSIAIGWNWEYGPITYGCDVS